MKDVKAAQLAPVKKCRIKRSFCHFHPLALAFHPSGWGLVSDSGTIACLELLW
jgi:hypothetical protein